MRQLLLILFLTMAAMPLAACAPPAFESSPSQENKGTTRPTQQTGLADPSAVYCRDQGFRYETRTDAQGNEYGVCIFDDGTECDAWAYFRGTCGQDKAKNLALNLVQAAGLEETVQIDILTHKTSSVDPDVSRHPIQPGMEVILTISDPETVQSLIEPLNVTLPLTPPIRCPARYILRFHLKSGETRDFQLGICGLRGDSEYFKGMAIRPPQEFITRFNALLKQSNRR